MLHKDIVSLLVLLGLLDVPLLVLTWHYRKHLPPTVSWWYGYRTERSMRSQAAWHAANAFSSRLLWCSMWYLPLAQLVAGSIWGGLAAALASVLFILGQATTIVVRTERLLRRSFPNEP